MKAVSSEEFLRWATDHDVGVDPRYPDSGCLSVLPPTDHARFWVVPGDPATWPHFIASLLGGLDEWATGLLWPRSGCWPKFGQSQSHNEGVRDVLLRGAGIPDGSSGAVRFSRDEEDVLVAVLFAFVAFGWCMDDDLFFIPDHARQLLQTDHHDVIHAECRSKQRVLELVAHMAAEGYELPDEPPDWTFKRPAWMGAGEAEPDATANGGRDPGSS
jgi:hypothetical protein